MRISPLFREGARLCRRGLSWPVRAPPPPGACVSAPPAGPALSAPPIRFVLTFDDGPKGPVTAAILDALADNAVQPGIKAVFFVQPRSEDGGDTPEGR